jgi:recombinational DNA repair protein (RecF pathway)
MSQQNYKKGYIINCKNYSQSSSVVTIFSQDKIKTAIVKGSRSKSKINECNVGNEVSFCHFGRDGSLGVFAIQVVKSPIINNMYNVKLILCVFAICELVYNLVDESFCEYLLLYSKFENFVNLANNKNPLCLEVFYDIERTIINYSGYNENFVDNESLDKSTSYNKLLKSLSMLEICESKFFYRKQFNSIVNQK